MSIINEPRHRYNNAENVHFSVSVDSGRQGDTLKKVGRVTYNVESVGNKSSNVSKLRREFLEKFSKSQVKSKRFSYQGNKHAHPVQTIINNDVPTHIAKYWSHKSKNKSGLINQKQSSTNTHTSESWSIQSKNKCLTRSDLSINDYDIRPNELPHTVWHVSDDSFPHDQCHEEKHEVLSSIGHDSTDNSSDEIQNIHDHDIRPNELPHTLRDESKNDSFPHDQGHEEKHEVESNIENESDDTTSEEIENDITRHSLRHNGDSEAKDASLLQVLGVFYIVNVENYTKAQEYLNKALQARIKLYGSHDLRVAETLTCLAHVREARNDKQGAIEKYKDALNIVNNLRRERRLSGSEESFDVTRKKSKGDYMSVNHLHKILIHNLKKLGVEASSHVDQEKHPASKDLVEEPIIFNSKEHIMKTLETRLKIYGENDIHVAETQTNLADVLASENDLDGAIALYSKALAIIGGLCRDGDKSYLEKCYVLRRREGKRGYVDINHLRNVIKEKLKKLCDQRDASRRHSLGVFYSDLLKKNDKAGEYLSNALQTRRKSYGDKNITVAKTQISLGDVMLSEGNEKNAIQHYQNALEIVKSLCDDRIKFKSENDPDFWKRENQGIKNIDLARLYQSLTLKLNKLGIENIGTHVFCECVNITAPLLSNNSQSSHHSNYCLSQKVSSSDEGNQDCNDSDRKREEELEKKKREKEKELEQKKREEENRLMLQHIEMIKEGIVLYDSGKVLEAKVFYDEHIDSWIKNLGENHSLINRVREDLGDIEFLLRKFDKAQLHYENALNAYMMTSSKEYSRLLHKKAITSLRLMDEKSAAESFEKALEINKIIYDDKTHPEVEENNIPSLIEVASIFYNKGDLVMSKKTLAKVLLISKQKSQKQNPVVFNMIGMIHYLEGNFHEAIHYFERALRCTEDCDNVVAKQVVHIFFNLGQANLQIMNLENAILYFKRATTFLSKSNLSDFDMKQDQIRFYTKIGMAHFHLGDLDQAYNNFKMAHEMKYELFNDWNVTRKIRYHMGLTRSHQLRFDEALIIFDDIINIDENDGWQDDIIFAQTHFDMCEIFLLRGSSKLSNEEQFQQSHEHYKCAMDILSDKKLQIEHPLVKQGMNLQKLIGL